MSVNLVKKLHWLGHDTFRIDAGKVIYFDPIRLPAGAPKADIILISHEHHDHYSPTVVADLMKPTTSIVTVKSVAEQIKRKADLHVVKPGDRVTVQGVEIEAVPAYNVNKQYHPRQAGHVGFIVTVDGERIYHAGDTDVIPEMATFKVDVALLPVSGKFVMTAEEAVEAAGKIKPKVAIPMHYGEIIGDESDAARFKAKSPVETIILQAEK
jgi:L-ascorbate metabolism protein UlaG (beta-lactamase superfamily)